MTNWLQKLKSGLSRSSQNLSLGISEIFTSAKLSPEKLEELEEILICSDMGATNASKIIKDFGQNRLHKEITETEIKTELANKIAAILKPCEQPFVLGTHQPTVILMVGVNGAGKTTTIGKLAAKFPNKKISFIAGDTFRAAAVEQLDVWGQRNNIRVYKGQHGCDAAGLCFDGLKEALRQKDNIVFIDTAGRLENKIGLMDELKKITKVIKKIIPEAPHHTLLCLDATTGQNALNQVKAFKDMVQVNGLIINKLDGTAKGGIVVALASDNPLPIYYIGIGEGIDDLDTFNAHDFSLNLIGLA